MPRERTCIASGEALPEERLVRFARAPDGAVTPDVAAKLPGRGLWVSADRVSVERAVKRNAFTRGFKAPATAPADLADQVEALLARRCLDLLGMAQRAGAIAIGTVQAEEAIRRGPPLWLIEAADGAADGRSKLIRLAFGLWGEEPRVAGCFLAGELGVALGRDPVVHAVLLQESMAQRWTVEIGRLSGFRAIVPASWPPLP